MSEIVTGVVSFPYANAEYECSWLNENTLLFQFDNLTAEYHKENGKFEVFAKEMSRRVRIYSDYPDRPVEPSRYAFGDLEINLIKMEMQEIISSGILLENAERE